MAKCAKAAPTQSPMHSRREDVDVAGDEDLDSCECRCPDY